jgi:ankyrin repeat protein
MTSGDTEVISKLLESPMFNTLHLAIRTSKLAVVELVVSQCPLLVNTQDSKGQTPLHVAAAMNRADVVTLLLSRPDVDDTIRDNAGCTFNDLASGQTVSIITGMSNRAVGYRVEIER